MKLRVLLIDDDAEKTQSHASDCVRELRADKEGFAVAVQTSQDGAIDHIIGLTNDDGPEDVVVLDIMMPIEKNQDQRPRERRAELDPMEVGYNIISHYLRPVESTYRSVPVLVLTNKDCEEVQRRVEGIGGVWIRHKSEVPSFHLPRLLREIVEKSKKMGTFWK